VVYLCRDGSTRMEQQRLFSRTAARRRCIRLDVSVWKTNRVTWS